jgi:hypothetical protein
MITALAAETLLVSVLAWMSIQASVTLAAILTVILLPWALLSMRQSAGFAWMTLAMLAMLWRGEAWKTVFLQSEQQVLEPQQRQQPHTSSRTEYSIPDSLLACDDARCVLRCVSTQFLVGGCEEGHPKRQWYSCAVGELDVLDIKNGNVSAIPAKKGLVAFRVLRLALRPAQFHVLRVRSQPDISGDLAPNCQNQSDPTPIDFI